MQKREKIIHDEEGEKEGGHLNEDENHIRQDEKIEKHKRAAYQRYIKDIEELYLSFDAEQYTNGVRFGDYYKFQNVIGKGSFGQVLNAIQKSDGQPVAIKVIDKRQFKKFEMQFVQEAKILQSLDHPNIVKFLTSHESSKTFMIVMEYFEGETLDEFIRGRKQNPFTEKEIIMIMTQILKAIQHMHQQEILHRDLKPENILIRERSQSKFEIRIIDFGLSFKIEQIGTMTDNCGTLIYMAPEVAFNRQYRRSVDLWSCGIIQYMLFTMGQHPLWVPSDTKDEYLEKMKNPKWNFPSNMNREARQFFLKTASPITEDRMTAQQCLKHVWISGEGNLSDPMTMADMIAYFSKTQIVSQIMKAIIALQMMKQKCIKVEYDEDYQQGDHYQESYKIRSAATQWNLKQEEDKSPERKQPQKNSQESLYLLSVPQDNMLKQDYFNQQISSSTSISSTKFPYSDTQLDHQSGMLRKNVSDLNLNKSSNTNPQQFNSPSFNLKKSMIQRRQDNASSNVKGMNMLSDRVMTNSEEQFESTSCNKLPQLYHESDFNILETPSQNYPRAFSNHFQNPSLSLFTGPQSAQDLGRISVDTNTNKHFKGSKSSMAAGRTLFQQPPQQLPNQQTETIFFFQEDKSYQSQQFSPTKHSRQLPSKQYQNQQQDGQTRLKITSGNKVPASPFIGQHQQSPGNFHRKSNIPIGKSSIHKKQMSQITREDEGLNEFQLIQIQKQQSKHESTPLKLPLITKLGKKINSCGFLTDLRPESPTKQQLIPKSCSSQQVNQVGSGLEEYLQYQDLGQSLDNNYSQSVNFSSNNSNNSNGSNNNSSNTNNKKMPNKSHFRPPIYKKHEQSIPH